MIPQSEITRQRKLLESHALHDREPLPPPFGIGTRVRYIGPRRSPEDGGVNGAMCRRDLLEPGTEFTVVRVSQGQRGDLTQYTDEEGKKMWWDADKTIPMLHTTLDGTASLRGLYGRNVSLSGAMDWEVVMCPHADTSRRSTCCAARPWGDEGESDMCEECHDHCDFDRICNDCGDVLSAVLA